MNRLRDEVGVDPVSERGLGIIRGVRPTSGAPELKRRVWSALERADSSRAGRTRPGVRVAALAVAIVLLAGTAGAMVSGRWIVPALQSRTSDAGAPSARPERARSVRWGADVASLAPTTTEAPLPGPALPALVEPAVASGATFHRSGTPSRGSAAGKSPAVATRSSTSSARERTEVLDALIALRRDHDPVRAGALLEHYLRVHPRGALREEALVLAIEAADAHGDRLLALTLARGYQADYPTGRFRQFSRDHIESNGSRSPSPSISFDGARGAASPAARKE